MATDVPVVDTKDQMCMVVVGLQMQKCIAKCNILHAADAHLIQTFVDTQMQADAVLISLAD